jgi:hypothetical protein
MAKLQARPRRSLDGVMPQQAPQLHLHDLFTILTGVAGLITQHLEQLVEPSSQYGSAYGSSPVYPVLRREVAVGNTRTKASGRIERASCVIDAGELSGEER